MATNPINLEKNSKLESSEDYLFLRRKGIEYIEQMGSNWWTDYNSHDPGITILEALCYAITELGFRTGWNIKDILAEPPESKHTPERQAFYTARNILTVNPLTISDFRRILIDLDKVANAWLICNKCLCEVPLYADCEKDKLTFEHPDTQNTEIKVTVQGTYDVLLELDHDPVLGDLNDRKIQHTFILNIHAKNYAITAEFRFPVWDSSAWGLASGYVDKDGLLLRKIKTFKLKVLLNKTGEGTLAPDVESRRWKQWNRVFFATIEILFEDATAILLQDVPLRLFGVTDVSQTFKDTWDLTDITHFENEFIIGVAQLFIKKMATVERTLEAVKIQINNYRNLCEDFYNLSVVCIEDVAVCADIEVAPDTDIEWVLANVLFEIEHYFNPDIKFYTLQELMDEGMQVDEAFDGPRLNHGFIKQADLEASQLKSQLRTSDIINRLVEIKGVLAVKSLLLTRYDQNGQAVTGVADISNTKEKTSAAWTLEISDRCQPRLYVDNSKFIFYKNDLPFIPRPSEVQDTLNQLRGQDERLKIRNLTPEELDLPVPVGSYRSLTDYYPVQYTFPLNYGIGFEGLREPSSKKRHAQAKQLKGYLLFFEQLLINTLAQIANVKNLFSLDESQLHTYFFSTLRDEALIKGVTELLSSELNTGRLQQLVESEPEQLDRRNRFLDHLMARFAESFSDYAMMLYSSNMALKPVTQATLIKQKIAFIKNYPVISRDRNKSFNYLDILPTSENQPVLRQRIALLLGLKPEVEDSIIIVEHLLLRPKFPGDALMEVCLNKNCTNCDEKADPYSFQLTVIMPGWQEPFNKNIELRRFADRTIQLEIPAHLLGKICWVSNLNYGEGRENNLLIPLSQFLRNNGKNAGNFAPSELSAQLGAQKFLVAAQPVFFDWIKSGANKGLSGAGIKTALKNQLEAGLPALVDIYSGVKNYDQIGNTVFEMLTDHFTRITEANHWFLYTRFKTAWAGWLEANAKFRWDNEQVLRKMELALSVLGISRSNVLTRKRRTSQLAERFGAIFSEEMRTNALEDKIFNTREEQQKEVLRIFNLAFTGNKIRDFGIILKDENELAKKFSNIYSRYIDVTIKLWKVLLSLSKLQSIYPPATLHDCDDSNDDNPVRLGSTMLGG
ncbi:hypothetical protein [Methylobacter psychrophilus]|uniref:hypothetical protein n=1 Tax=Methylobacter psychrophilus TaxID=96941 RepID=UPI0021D515C4|nr:hypothetical protein [Methylobacter psychrophilus]